jgi:tetratricopeptide (TPR) repeat protein
MRPFPPVNSIRATAFGTVALCFGIVLTAIAPASAQSAAAPPGGETAGYYFLLGRHLENAGKIDEAIAAHRKALGIAPQSAELYAELAGLYARQNRAVESIEAAEAALTRDPNNREANRILGSVLAALSEQRQPLRPGDNAAQYGKRAIAALEKAQRDGILDVGIELMLGRLYVQAGEHAKAIAPLRRVVDDQPGYPEAAMLLAAAYEATGRAADAITLLEGTIAQNPGFFRGRVRLAELYEGQRRFKEAAETYAQAQAEDPRADLMTSRATAMINAGQVSEARDMLQAALTKKGSPDAGLLYLLAQAHRRLGDGEAAGAAAAQLKKAFPTDLRGLFLDAQLAEEDGRTEDALAAFKALIARVPEDATLVYQYANLLDRTGRSVEAERALRGVLERDPLDANALNSLGYMFAERGEKLGEAVELLHRALKIEPGNPSFLDSLGWAYFKQGRVDLADGPLSEAAKGLPGSSVVQDHLGDLRLKQQRYADAAAAWEQSLKGDGESIDRAKIEKKLRDVRERLKK